MTRLLKILTAASIRIWAEHLRDYVPLSLAECVFLASQLLVFWLVSRELAPRGFSEFLLAKRVTAIFQIVFLFGIDLALSRFTALECARSEAKAAGDYLVSALLVVGSGVALAVVTLLAFRDVGAFLLFGDREHSYLIPPVTLMFSGTVLSALAYASLLGSLSLARAAWFRIVTFGIIPPVMVLSAPASASSFLTWMGAGWCLISVVVVLVLLRSVSPRDVFFRARQLVRYGLPRVPGTAMQSAMMSLPSILTAHLAGVVEAGYVALAVSFLLMSGMIYRPLMAGLLPKASHLIGRGAIAELRAHVNTLLAVCAASSAAITVFALLLARPLVAWFFGGRYDASVPLIQITMLACVPYAFFIVFRGMLHAAHEQAINTWNVMIAFVVFLISTAVGWQIGAGSAYLVGSLVFSLTLLGGLTLFRMWQLSSGWITMDVRKVTSSLPVQEE